jgi:L-ascorbate metabolism protein UlaG (beta-lactamase superfamily)
MPGPPNRFRWLAPGGGITLLLATILSACMSGPRMPAIDGAVIEVRRSDRSIDVGEVGYEDTLQLYWFGSGCHLIRLGELSVLTDPFVTNGPALTDFQSSGKRVGETFGRIQPPEAVLINHCHFDHFLDARAALAQASWKQAGVPLYGGTTCRNLIAGWGDREVTNRCHPIAKEGGRVGVVKLPEGYRLQIHAYEGTHGPHLKCGYTAFDGSVSEELENPPDSIDDYRTGEALNYWVKMTKSGKSFTVFYLGAIGDLKAIPERFPDGKPLDVLLLCAPGADKVSGFSYPEDVLKRLRPRHVVLSHFNTFLKEDPDEQLSVGRADLIRLDEISRKIQQAGLTYAGFEKLHIPAITRVAEGGTARNVVLLK